ncbi:MAG: hypothetical protein ACETWR_05875 [Anaerolineae bacterium]
MPREMRYRPLGILFYLVVVLSLAATRQGQCFVRQLFASSTGSDNAQLWVAAFAVGAGVFTSDAVGFALSALFFFVWQLSGGYSALWEKKLSYNPKKFIVDEYGKKRQGAGDEAPTHEKFEEQWESYSSEVFLSLYFAPFQPNREQSLSSYGAFLSHFKSAG